MTPHAQSNPADTLVELEAAILRLRASRRRLECDPMSGRGGDDALIYIEAAEMHLKAARCRLAEMLPPPGPKPVLGLRPSGGAPG